MKHHGIEITVSYQSPSTARTCRTIQGYTFPWFTGTSWAESQKAARTDIDRLRARLDGDLSKIRSGVLKWAARQWGEFQERVDVEIARREGVMKANKDAVAARKAKLELIRELAPDLKATHLWDATVVVDCDALVKLLEGV